MWCFDRDWAPVSDGAHTWLRVKLDAFALIDDDHAVVIDYKTGKKFGNEIKHAQQCQLYQLAAFLRYPELEKITAELWYLDVDDISTQTFTRTQGLKFFKGFDNRAREMTSTTIFRPKANVYNCKFCPYAPAEYSNKWVNKSGDCRYGIS
jgi:RecB family exonuclease